MGQLSRHLHFAQESLGSQGGGQLGPEDLDGDLAMVLQVFREIDRGHPPRPDLAFDPVPIRQGDSEAIDSFRHEPRYSAGSTQASVQRWDGFLAVSR